MNEMGAGYTRGSRLDSKAGDMGRSARRSKWSSREQQKGYQLGRCIMEIHADNDALHKASVQANETRCTRKKTRVSSLQTFQQADTRPHLEMVVCGRSCQPMGCWQSRLLSALASCRPPDHCPESPGSAENLPGRCSAVMGCLTGGGMGVHPCLS